MFYVSYVYICDHFQICSWDNKGNKVWELCIFIIWGGITHTFTKSPYCLWFIYIKINHLFILKEINSFNTVQWLRGIFRAKALSTSAPSARLKKTCQEFDSWENTTHCLRISVEAAWIPVSSCLGIRGFRRRWKPVSSDTHKSLAVHHWNIAIPATEERLWSSWDRRF